MNQMIEPCPFCGDVMMWEDDAAGDPVFFHEQTTVLGATCFLRHALFVAERADAWNTRAYNPDERLREALEEFLREAYGRAFDEGAESTIEQWQCDNLEAPQMPHKDCKNEGAYQFVEDLLPKLSALSPLPQGDD